MSFKYKYLCTTVNILGEFETLPKKGPQAMGESMNFRNEAGFVAHLVLKQDKILWGENRVSFQASKHNFYPLV